MSKSSQDFFKNENDRNDFYISIPVIAIAAIFILWQWGKSDPPILQKQATEKTTAFISTESSFEKVISPISTSPQLEKEIESDIPHHRTNSPKVTTIKSETNKPILNTDVPVISNGDISKPDLQSETPQDSAEQISIGKEEILESPKNENKPTVLSIDVATPDSDTKIIPEESLDCSIAVGLYREETNLNKMFNKLIQSGYSAIRVPLRNSTKVVIKIPCNKTSSVRILEEIRANFATDAFIE